MASEVEREFTEFKFGKIRILAYHSEADSTPVVEIIGGNDDDNGCVLRVYLNEATLYENPLYPR